MKMIKCLSVLFVSFLFLMTGCAPKVITNISKSYPASVTADKVRLYELGEAVPSSAERIGNVSVVDNGVSTKCNYDQVVWLAKQETAKAGGNALALTDHRKPSLLGSSCHQIAGSMLLVSDTAAFRAAPLSKALDLEEEAVVEKSSFEHNTIYANIGYAFVTSKFYLPPGGSGHPKNGLDWQVGYDWISRSGFGAGLLYSGYKSSYIYSGIDINVGLTYVAPQFVMKQIINRWIVEEKIGIGYFSYRESARGISESLSGVGYNFSLGAEYLLSKHVGVGLNIGYVGGSLPKQENVSYDKGDYSGLFRLTFDAGVRFHF